MSADSESLKIRTKSVEKVLEPLILQLSVIVTRKDVFDKPKGLSRSAEEILGNIKETIDDFLEKGNRIAGECLEMSNDFKIVISEVNETGQHFYNVVKEFLESTTNPNVRKCMTRSARSLLSSVTRLLILADLVDVQNLHFSLQRFKQDVENLSHATDQRGLTSYCSSLQRNLKEYSELMEIRLQDLLDPTQREDLDLARYRLKLGCSVLISSSKVYITHPELATAAATRAYAVKSCLDALERVSKASDSIYKAEELSAFRGQYVNRILEEIVSNATTWSSKPDKNCSSTMHTCVERLSKEISNLLTSADLGNSFSTSINEGLLGLQVSIDEFLEAWKYQTRDGIQNLFNSVKSSCDRIKETISKAALNLCLNSMTVDDNVLVLLEEAALTTDESKLVLSAKRLQRQTTELIDAALCLCSLSADVNSIRFARQAANDLEELTPQLINASKVLALRPNSSTANQNFTVIANTYTAFLRMLRTAVDDMTDVTMLIEVYEEILERNLETCCTEASAKKLSSLIRASKVFCANCYHACDFLSAELNICSAEPTETEQIRFAIQSVRDVMTGDFSDITKDVCRCIKSGESAKLHAIENTGKKIISKFKNLRKIFSSLSEDRIVHHADHAESEFDLESISSFDSRTYMESSLSSGQSEGRRYHVEAEN